MEETVNQLVERMRTDLTRARAPSVTPPIVWGLMDAIEQLSNRVEELEAKPKKRKRAKQPATPAGEPNTGTGTTNTSEITCAADATS